MSRPPDKPAVQTILGAGGVIGQELMRELSPFTDRIRLIRRRPTPPSPGMETMSADLLDAQQVDDAVRGSDVAYLVAGLAYRTTVWQAQWPTIMRNVINTCKRHDVRLVFFDNVYLYGRPAGPMTEETPVNPCSHKGEVRARIAEMLSDEIHAGSVKALIVRAADFYGLGATHTFVHPLVFELLRDGKKANWLGNDRVPHSMTFTPDAGRATALLGNTEDAYGQIWHLPTHPSPPTGQQFVEHVAAAFGVHPRYRVLGRRTLEFAGLFSPTIRESVELLYQNEQPYIVDSTKFSQHFFTPTPYTEGIRKTARCMFR